MFEINKVRMVLVSLIVPRDEKIIEEIGEGWKETKDSLEARRERQIPGKVIIRQTNNCDAATFLVDLADAGFELIGATYKILLGDHRAQVQVKFVPRRDAEDYRDWKFEQIRSQVERELKSLLRKAYWSIGAWDDAFSLDGHEVGRMGSVVLRGRKPRHEPDGTPVTKWLKDQSGQRIGVEAPPITPDYELRIQDGTFRLIEV